MFTCGWCNTHYKTWQESCQSCGGPMPTLPGMDPGPEPEPPPRAVPPCFVRAQQWSRNPLVLGGAFLLVAGSAAFLPGVFTKSWLALIPLVFAVMGAVVLSAGRKEAARILDAFRLGRAVKGEIVSVQLDSPYQVNGRHPWRIVYTFKTSDGISRRGAVITFDGAAPQRQPGQPVWVLVVDACPQQNTIYPPVK